MTSKDRSDATGDPSIFSRRDASILIRGALESSGLPESLMESSIRMALWSEVFHGVGLRILSDRRDALCARRQREARRIGANFTEVLAGSPPVLSALTDGPFALDLATAMARDEGLGVAEMCVVIGAPLLGYLAERGARRNLATLILAEGAPDRPLAFAGLPGADGPLLLETVSDSPSAAHARLHQAAKTADPWESLSAAHDDGETEEAARAFDVLADLFGDVVADADEKAPLPTPASAIVCCVAMPDQAYWPAFENAVIARISDHHANDRDRGFALRLPQESQEMQNDALANGFDAPSDIVDALRSLPTP